MIFAMMPVVMPYVEIVGMVLAVSIVPPLTWYDIFKNTLVLIGVASLFVMATKWATSPEKQTRMLLDCDRETAAEMDYIMRKKRIKFMEFHRNVCAAMGYFLPLYGRVVDDRPVADGGETRQAIIFAMTRDKIHAGMRTSEFIQVVAQELVHFRDDKSPLTDVTRQVDGIMF